MPPLPGADPRDPATIDRPAAPDYLAELTADGLRGARIGVPREVYWGYSEKADRIGEAAIATMRDLGAVIVDPANIPTARDMASGWPPSSNSSLTVLLYEFKADIAAYLAELGPDLPVRTLDDLIAFNERHREAEMPYFGQELFVQANAKGPSPTPIIARPWRAITACRAGKASTRSWMRTSSTRSSCRPPTRPGRSTSSTAPAA